MEIVTKQMLDEFKHDLIKELTQLSSHYQSAKETLKKQ